jgi:hypothetical protein
MTLDAPLHTQQINNRSVPFRWSSANLAAPVRHLCEAAWPAGAAANNQVDDCHTILRFFA